MPSEDEKKKDAAEWRQGLMTVGLALAIPWMIALPALVGWYVDKSSDTWPLWFIVGLSIGLVGTALDIYKLMKRFGQFK